MKKLNILSDFIKKPDYVFMLIIVWITISLPLTNFAQSDPNDPCFIDEALKFKWDVTKGGIGFCGTPQLNVPLAMGYYQTYPVSGKFNCDDGTGQVYYSSCISQVRAGWMNDESETSTTFFETGTWDYVFHNYQLDKGAFGDNITIPDDDEAHKHKFVKLRITCIANGGKNTPAFFTYYIIYRIPIANYIKGAVKSIDIPDNPQVDDYKKTALPYSDQHKVTARVISSPGNYEYKTDIDDNGCFQVNTNPGHTNSSLIVHDDASASNLGTESNSFNFQIDNPSDGAKIEIWDHLPLIDKIRKAEKKLDNKYISWNTMLDKTLTWEIVKAISYYVNWANQTSSNPAEWKTYVYDLPPSYQRFDPPKLNNLLTSYQSYVRNYLDINGEKNDEFRTEFLMRTLYGLNASDAIYDPMLKVSHEMSKIFVSLGKLIVFWNEAKAVSDFVYKMYPDLAQQKLILSLAASGAQVVKGVQNLLNTWYPSKNGTQNQANNTTNEVVRAFNVAQTSYLDAVRKKVVSSNLLRNDPLERVKGMMKDDILDASSAIVASGVWAPVVIGSLNSNYDQLADNFGFKKWYYNYSLAVRKTSKDAYFDIDMISNENTALKKFINSTERNVSSSKDARNILGIASSIGSIVDLLKLAKKITAKQFLKIPALVGLSSALLLDLKSFGDGFCLTSYVPLANYLPTLPIDDWVSYYWGDMSSKPKSVNYISNTNYKSKSKGYYNDIKNKLSSISDKIILSSDQAMLAASQNDSTTINTKFYSIIGLADSLTDIHNQISQYLITVSDSASKADTTFSKNFQNLNYENSIAYAYILGFDSYLFDVKKKLGTLDTLKLFQDSLKMALNNYQNSISLTLDKVVNIPSKPYISIRSVKLLPDTIIANVPFKVKIKVYNPGTITVDSIKVTISPDSLTKANSSQILILDSLAENDEKELEYDLIFTNPYLNSGYFKIDISSKQTYYSTVETFSLNVKPFNSYTIEGTIKYAGASASPMRKIFLGLHDLEGKGFRYTVSDTNGYYKFDNVVNGEYNIIASTDKLCNGSGIDPGDALVVNRNYIGMVNFSDSLYAHAADVNNDLSNDPGDALMINRKYIGAITGFTAGEWLFEKPSVIVNNSNITLNIKSVCFGDVNGDYQMKK